MSKWNYSDNPAIAELQRIKDREDEIAAFRERVKEAWAEATRPVLTP